MGESGLMSAGANTAVKIHDFRERLNFSEVASDEPFWLAVYRKAFPTMVNCMLTSGRTEGQKLGVDRVIYLANNRIIRIDEKKREKDYDDILLEYVSVNTTGAPGWIEKDLAIDYIAYAFMPSKRVYLFPWDMLKRCWLNYRTEWLNKYKIPPAQNRGYQTLSVAVPIAVLKEAVRAAAIIQL
jgi:hypothetical protein